MQNTNLQKDNEELLREINYSKFQIDPSIKMRMFDIDGMPLDVAKQFSVDPTEEEGEVIFELNAGIKPGTKIQKHMDYELWEMTPEQREVYEALQCEEEGVYDELEDDFVIEANDGKVPMVMKSKEVNEEDLKRVMEMYNEEEKEEGQSKEGLMGIDELKSIVRKDIKEYGVKVKAKQKKEEKEEGSEIKLEEMGIMELESIFKKVNKKYDVVEEKTQKMKGGGLFIFKRVKKKKKETKEEKKKVEFDEDIKEEKQVPVEDNNSDAYFSESDNEEEQFENEQQEDNAFRERGRFETLDGKGDKDAWKKDDFIKQLDKMIDEEEIIGLSSSEEEEENENEKKKKQREMLEQLEEEYQKNLQKQREETGLTGRVKVTMKSEFKKKKKEEKQIRKEERKQWRKEKREIKKEMENYGINKEELKEIKEEEEEVEGEKVVVMKSKAERKRMQDDLIESKGMNEYLREKGMLGAVLAQKKFEEKLIKGELNEYVPTMEEYFGGGKEDVGNCEMEPDFDVHENIYCMKVVKEETEIKRVKVEKEKEEEIGEDYEEVEREDIAKKLKRKRKETKEERKKRKQMIKERKKQTKEKRKKFKEKFDEARKERIKHDNIDKARGNLKGISHYKIN
jgi:hypothetical protein